MEVLQTKNYEIFNKLQGNRAVNHANKERLKDSFKKNYVISPILVNENLQIIDGQHRLQAAKELGLPVYYIISKGTGLKEVQVLNVNQKNWAIDDYVDGYIDMGKDNYRIYKTFRKQFNLPATQTIEILEGSSSSGSKKDKVNFKNHVHNFKNGNLKIKNLKESERVAKAISSCSPFYEGYKRKTFVAAMMGILKKDNFEIDTFLYKLSKYNNLMQDCVNVTAYTELIEEIYNYRNRNKINLRF